MHAQHVCGIDIPKTGPIKTKVHTYLHMPRPALQTGNATDSIVSGVRRDTKKKESIRFNLYDSYRYTTSSSVYG